MRKLAMIRSLKAAVFLSVLMLMPLFVMQSQAFYSAYAIALCALYLPGLLYMAALWGGLLPAAVGLVSGVLAAWLPYGWESGVRMLIYLAPGLLALLICAARDVPFHKTALITVAAEMAGGFAVLLIMNRQADGALAQKLADQFGQLIQESDQRDTLLLAMLQSGYARLDPSMYGQATNFFGGLSALGREELLLSLKTTLTEMLRLLPALLITYAIWHGLAGIGAGIYFGRRSVIRQIVDQRRKELMAQALEQRRAELESGAAPGPVRLQSQEQMMRELSGRCEEELRDFPTLRMPPFSYWHLPRRIGLMAALPALGYLVALTVKTPQAQLIGNMLGAVFTALYTIQGMASLDYVIGHAHRPLGLRCAILAVVTVLFSRAFLVLGILDQLANFRKLRPPLGGTQNE